jgi:hypothetical protein
MAPRTPALKKTIHSARAAEGYKELLCAHPTQARGFIGVLGSPSGPGEEELGAIALGNPTLHLLAAFPHPLKLGGTHDSYWQALQLLAKMLPAGTAKPMIAALMADEVRQGAGQAFQTDEAIDIGGHDQGPAPKLIGRKRE